MQLGTGAAAIALGKLSSAQERLIAALYKGIADQQFPVVAKQLGLSKAEAESVVNAVGEVMLNEAPETKTKISLSDDFVTGAFAEIIRASLLHSVDGQQVLLGRAERSIHIDSLGRAGLSIALGLAAAGIGHLVSDDNQKVDAENLGPTGYPTQLKGHPRIDAVRSILAASPNKAMVSTGLKLSKTKQLKLDCAVLISQQATDPSRYAKLRAKIHALEESIGARPWQRTKEQVWAAGRLPAHKHREMVDAALLLGKNVPEAVLASHGMTRAVVGAEGIGKTTDLSAAVQAAQLRSVGLAA